ncbi:MAG TPA: hypothetical protein VHK67_02995 [Rhabdochlamydiaceae bacterium]|jgi:hypothetical protein|nr:hypothetical protein [Rhabdochlamydiaceae bacterium]
MAGFQSHRELAESRSDWFHCFRSVCRVLFSASWGDAQREGVILAHKYQFNLRIVQAGFIEGNVVGDKDLVIYKNLKEDLQKHDPKSTRIAELEGHYQTRYRELCNLEANYFTEDQTLLEESPYPVTLTIALFGKHFVPVFDHGRGDFITVEHFS